MKPKKIISAVLAAAITLGSVTAYSVLSPNWGLSAENGGESELEAPLADEDVVEVASAGDLTTIEAGKTYRLTGDVELSGTVNVNAANVTLDLNGHELSVPESFVPNNALVVTAADFKLTDSSDAKDGVFLSKDSKNAKGYMINIVGGTMTVDGGTVRPEAANMSSIRVKAGTFTLAGGTIEKTKGPHATLIKLEDKDGSGEKGVFNMTGGTLSCTIPTSDATSGNMDFIATPETSVGSTEDTLDDGVSYGTVIHCYGDVNITGGKVVGVIWACNFGGQVNPTDVKVGGTTEMEGDFLLGPVSDRYGTNFSETTVTVDGGTYNIGLLYNSNMKKGNGSDSDASLLGEIEFKSGNVSITHTILPDEFPDSVQAGITIGEDVELTVNSEITEAYEDLFDSIMPAGKKMMDTDGDGVDEMVDADVFTLTIPSEYVNGQCAVLDPNDGWKQIADSSSPIVIFTAGDQLAIQAWNDYGYKAAGLKAVYGDPETELTLGEGGQCTMPADNVTVTCTFEPMTVHEITLNYDDTKGSAEYEAAAPEGTYGDPDALMIEGDEITVSAAPAKGYELDEITASYNDGAEDVDIELAENKFTLPDADVEITVTFTAVDYSVNLAEPTNGSADVDKTTANIGDTVSVTDIEAEDGYELDTITVVYIEDGKAAVLDITEDKSFEMPAADVAVIVTFKESAPAKTPHKVEVDKEVKNGTVTVDKTTASVGDTVTVSATPAEGYKLGSVTVSYEDADGTKTVAPKDGKTFTMPDADVTVSAEFEAIAYKINITVPENGTVKTEPAAEAKTGEEVTVTAEPKEGYELDKITAADKDGKAVEVKEGKFVMPASDVTVTAAFKAKTVTPPPAEETTYKVNITVPENGTVKADPVEAKAGDTVTLTVEANEGYELDKLAVTDKDGKEVEVKDNKFVMPASDVTVTAAFKAKTVTPPPAEDTYKVNITVPENGKVTADPVEAKAGDTVTLTVEANEGFELDKLTVTDKDGKEIEVKDGTFVMPASDVTVTVTFKEKAVETDPITPVTPSQGGGSSFVSPPSAPAPSTPATTTAASTTAAPVVTQAPSVTDNGSAAVTTAPAETSGSNAAPAAPANNGESGSNAEGGSANANSSAGNANGSASPEDKNVATGISLALIPTAAAAIAIFICKRKK
ncbi:MAG: hypothetical protein NC394_10580 [Bacteroides sp.]|nr:hypothetical protein [Bacteroides sp.]